MLRRIAPGLVAAAIVLLADQIAKWAIVEFVMRPPRRIALTPFFNLVLGFNPGISFGMFQDALVDHALLFSVLKLAIVALLAWLLMRSDDAWERLAYGFMIGGALGNIADRVRLGAVVDFLDFHLGGWHWPSFNLADAALSIGVGVVLMRAWLAGSSRSSDAPDSR